MITIRQYELFAENEFYVLPKNAEILCVGVESGKPYIWAKVDTEAQTESRELLIIGTGHFFPNKSCIYIGTFQIYEFVFHVFEVLLNTKDGIGFIKAYDGLGKTMSKEQVGSYKEVAEAFKKKLNERRGTVR